MTTIAFLTSEAFPELTDDDRLTVDAFASRDTEIVPAVWTDDAVAYEDYDLVVIRSPWDWMVHRERFGIFLQGLERRARVVNERAWAWLDKRYLTKLAEAGVRTVPTQSIADRSAFDRIMREKKYSRAVLKPAVGAGGHGVVRVGDATDERQIAAIIEAGDAIVQPFLDEVETEGEWSLVFFDGELSHAIKKYAAPGEFRVHAEYGGRIERADPPRDVVEDAKRALEASGESFAYARVDGIASAAYGGFCLTELEVVEPELFFRIDPNAAARFAQAVLRRLRE